MRIISKALCASMLAASLAGFISTQADRTNCRDPVPGGCGDRNPSACQQFDAALSRVHTFTPAGDSRHPDDSRRRHQQHEANDDEVFTTTLGIGGTNFNVVADTSKSPKSPGRHGTAAWLPLECRRALA